MDASEAKAPVRHGRRSNRILAAVLGAAFGLAGVLLFWLLSFRDPLPPLSAEDFRKAQERWQANAVDNYDIEVRVRGRQPATYRVEVRDGEPAAAFRNGRPLTQKRTWGTWSVPGMFGTLASDFRHVAEVESGRADETTPRLGLYGVFDPRYGFPRRYRRITWSQGREESMAHRVGQGRVGAGGDAEMEVSWEVTEFTIRE
ncbi:MAG: hypothetical protein KY475_23645 [Planctomycetes bacterium]|nr:hypothetical protein [Planctomycetota bacterium]